MSKKNHLSQDKSPFVASLKASKNVLYGTQFVSRPIRALVPPTHTKTEERGPTTGSHRQNAHLVRLMSNTPFTTEEQQVLGVPKTRAKWRARWDLNPRLTALFHKVGGCHAIQFTPSPPRVSNKGERSAPRARHHDIPRRYGISLTIPFPRPSLQGRS